MKLKLKWVNDRLVVRFRVEQISGTKVKAFLAKVTGPHPDYIVNRCFQDGMRDRDNKKINLLYQLMENGIYEICEKRYHISGKFLSRERKWLVICDGDTRLYRDEEMNYQYVLYCSELLQLERKAAS